jgi:hypothetical protein
MKLKVKLVCQWDNGEEVFPPGTETEMERDQAFSLAGMGMVEVLMEKKQAEQVKPSTATKGNTAKAKGGRKGKAVEGGEPETNTDPVVSDDPAAGDLDPDRMGGLIRDPEGTNGQRGLELSGPERIRGGNEGRRSADAGVLG